MNKRVKVILLSVTAFLVTLFLLTLLLSLPIGPNGGVLPITALYVTGIVVASLFLAGAIFSLVYRYRRLTGGGEKYYDNGNHTKEGSDFDE